MVELITEQKIEDKKEEIKELKSEAIKEPDTERRKGLIQRIEKLENDLTEIQIAWKDLIEKTKQETEEKKLKREQHEKEVEEAKKKKQTIFP